MSTSSAQVTSAAPAIPKADGSSPKPSPTVKPGASKVPGPQEPQVPAGSASQKHYQFSRSTIMSQKPPSDEKKPESNHPDSPTSSTGSGASLSSISTHSERGSAIGSYISASGDDDGGRSRTISQVFRQPTASPTPPGDGLPPQDSPKK